MNDSYWYHLFFMVALTFTAMGWFGRGVWEAYKQDRQLNRQWTPLNRRIRGVN